MGVSASKRSGAKAQVSQATAPSEVWVTVKAKTTDKTTRAVTKKRWAFRASAAGVMLGSARTAAMSIADSNLNAQHARIYLNESGNVCLESKGRVYLLIGQGDKSNGPVALEKNQVVKMGACSLQVSETCVADPLVPSNRDENVVLSPSTALEEVDTVRAIDVSPHSGMEETDGAGAAASDNICYICFDDVNDAQHALMESPCACKKLVHKCCLQRWIASRGSRLCSICKSKLPIPSTVDPPFLVLTVVRHMRGLHWHGEREYIISFATSAGNAVTIGSGTSCDVALPDPSLSRVHAKVRYHDSLRSFTLEDCHSSAGTFLRLVSQYAIPEDTGATFKLGRTMLTVKTRRKGPGSSGAMGVLGQWRQQLSTLSHSHHHSPQSNGFARVPAALPLPSSEANGAEESTAVSLFTRTLSIPPSTAINQSTARNISSPVVDRDALIAEYMAENPEEDNIEWISQCISSAMSADSTTAHLNIPPILQRFLEIRGILRVSAASPSSMPSSPCTSPQMLSTVASTATPTPLHDRLISPASSHATPSNNTHMSVLESLGLAWGSNRTDVTPVTTLASTTPARPSAAAANSTNAHPHTITNGNPDIPVLVDIAEDSQDSDVEDAGSDAETRHQRHRGHR